MHRINTAKAMISFSGSVSALHAADQRFILQGGQGLRAAWSRRPSGRMTGAAPSVFVEATLVAVQLAATKIGQKTDCRGHRNRPAPHFGTRASHCNPAQVAVLRC